MLKVGDKLIAKLDFLIKNNISKEDREFKILESDKGIVKIQNKSGFHMITDSSYIREDFYLTDNINYELLKIIETGEIEFISFNGVTIDGKIIDVRK
jgi:hypothetical protein